MQLTRSRLIWGFVATLSCSTAPHSSGAQTMSVTSIVNNSYPDEFDGIYDGGVTGGSTDVSGVTGAQSGGNAVISGSIDLADPGSASCSGTNSCNLPFDQNATGQIFGISNGMLISHSLRFQWSTSAESAAASGHET